MFSRHSSDATIVENIFRIINNKLWFYLNEFIRKNWCGGKKKNAAPKLEEKASEKE